VGPDSPESLVQGIQRVIDDPGLAARLAEQAWRDVQRYTWRRRAAEVLAAAAREP
jgi:glycosyltransferase involved in cell wall biosynthesis